MFLQVNYLQLYIIYFFCIYFLHCVIFIGTTTTNNFGWFHISLLLLFFSSRVSYPRLLSGYFYLLSMNIFIPIFVNFSMLILIYLFCVDSFLKNNIHFHIFRGESAKLTTMLFSKNTELVNPFSSS